MGDCEAPLRDTRDQNPALPGLEEKQPFRCQQHPGIPGLQPMSIAMLVRAEGSCKLFCYRDCNHVRLFFAHH